jgi:hypothetical protein
MENSMRRLLAWTAGALLIAGCAAESTVRSVSMSGAVDQAEALGACLGPPADQFSPVSEALARRDVGWYDVDRVNQRGPAGIDEADRSVPVALEGSRSYEKSRSRTTGQERQARVFEPSVARLREAADRGLFLAVAIGPNSRVTMAVAEDEAGNIGFVGDCGFSKYTQPFLNYVAARANSGLSPAETLRTLVLEPDGDVASDFQSFFDRPIRTWANTPTDQRQFHPGETPADVMRSLVRFEWQVDVPATWRRDQDMQICGRTHLAWGECASLKASAGAPMVFPGLAVPQAELGLWLLPMDGGFSQPIGRVGVLSAADIDRSIKLGEVLHLVPMKGVTSPEKMTEEARAGRDSFEVKS